MSSYLESDYLSGIYAASPDLCQIQENLLDPKSIHWKWSPSEIPRINIRFEKNDWIVRLPLGLSRNPFNIGGGVGRPFAFCRLIVIIITTIIINDQYIKVWAWKMSVDHHRVNFFPTQFLSTVHAIKIIHTTALIFVLLVVWVCFLFRCASISCTYPCPSVSRFVSHSHFQISRWMWSTCRP